MSNPLYNAMRGNNISSMAQRINQLKQMYPGNPMDYVQKMLNSGRITQAQYDRAVQQAREIMKAMQKQNTIPIAHKGCKYITDSQNVGIADRR